MIHPRRSLLVLVVAGAVAFAVAACGDDTVTPSTPPDAAATKDATVEGGEGGHEAGRGDDSATEPDADAAALSDGGEEAAAEAGEAGGEGGTEGGVEAGEEGGDAATE